MAKKKTYAEQKKSLKKIDIEHDEQFKKFDPSAYIQNKKNIAAAIKECLDENDFEGILEIVNIYISSVKREPSVNNGNFQENKQSKKSVAANTIPTIAQPKENLKKLFN